MPTPVSLASSMIGLALSNSFPKVVAHGGLKPVLGTNPFAFGAPRANGDHLL
ncbi:MAG: Ldh family oxidoreductase, partial [Methylocella sp.]